MPSYQDDSDPIFPVGDKAEAVKGLFLDARPQLPFGPRHRHLGGRAPRLRLPEAEGKTIWKFGVRQPILGGSMSEATAAPPTACRSNTELFVETPTTVGSPA